MRALGRLSPDDRAAGRDLEVYLTIGVAVVVGLLSLLGVVDPQVVSAITLVILALVAYDLVTSRRQALCVKSAVQELCRLARTVDRPGPAFRAAPAATPVVRPHLATSADRVVIRVRGRRAYVLRHSRSRLVTRTPGHPVRSG